jgi:hypothetical protein
MIAAALAAASVLGARGLSMNDPARQALVVQSLGRPILRLDAAGLVQARGCDGRMRHVGLLPGQPVMIRIENDGALTGLSWDPAITAEQRAAFQQMVRAWGMSDRRGLAELCLPAPPSDPGARVREAITDASPAPALAEDPLAP